MLEYQELTEKDKKKNPVCCFEIWDKKENNVKACGIAAIGKRGESLKYPLCSEHYYYCKTMITK